MGTPHNEAAGAISFGLRLRDAAMAQGACTGSRCAHQLGQSGTFAPIADFTLLETVAATAFVKAGTTAESAGSVCSAIRHVESRKAFLANLYGVAFNWLMVLAFASQESGAPRARGILCHKGRR